MVSAKILCHNTFFMQGFISVVGINNERGNEIEDDRKRAARWNQLQHER